MLSSFEHSVARIINILLGKYSALYQKFDWQYDASPGTVDPGERPRIQLMDKSKGAPEFLCADGSVISDSVQSTVWNIVQTGEYFFGKRHRKDGLMKFCSESKPIIPLVDNGDYTGKYLLCSSLLRKIVTGEVQSTLEKMYKMGKLTPSPRKTILIDSIGFDKSESKAPLSVRLMSALFDEASPSKISSEEAFLNSRKSSPLFRELSAD
jgi:hypothetical protein